MTTAELRQLLKSGKPEGMFLFAGEEDYLKRHYIGEFRRAIITDEGLAPFMHYTFDGPELDFGALLDAVRTPTMFADGKLIEWHGVKLEGAKEKTLEALAALSEAVKENEGTALVITALADGLDVGSEKRPSKLFSTLASYMHAIAFFRSGDRELCGWIARHFSAEGIAFDEELPVMLLERVGHSMEVLASEIEKLVLYAEANGLARVGAQEMERVCVRTVESDAFSFTNAMLDGKTEDAYRFLFDMERRKVDPILALGQVARLYGDLLSVALLAEEGMTAKEIAAKLRIHEYKAGLYLRAAKKSSIGMIERNLSLCAELDAAMKNGSASYVGLQRLVASAGVHE